MENRRNYYRILHVQPDAPDEVIHASYLTLMRRLRMHPDLGGDHWNAVLINQAYATLRNPRERALYDRALARARGAMPGTTRGVEGPRALLSGAIGTFDLVSCLFCGARHAAGQRKNAAAVCAICGSPLCDVFDDTDRGGARRSFVRMDRDLPVAIYLEWPQARPFSAISTDLSIAGMRFRTTVELLPGELVKVESAFCDAVGIVRHARPGHGGAESSWDVGVEFRTFRAKVSRGGLLSVDA